MSERVKEKMAETKFRRRSSELHERTTGRSKSEVNFHHSSHSKMVFTVVLYHLQTAACLSRRGRNPLGALLLARPCATRCFRSCTRHIHIRHPSAAFHGASIHAVVQCSFFITIVWRKLNNYRKQLREKLLKQGAPSHVATTGCTWLWADLLLSWKLWQLIYNFEPRELLLCSPSCFWCLNWFDKMCSNTNATR